MEQLTSPWTVQLWQIGCMHGAVREKMHAVLGQPHYLETDTSRTYGGEEDWWGFKVPSGETAVICLRVPYQDAVIMTDTPNAPKAIFEALTGALSIGKLEIYEHVYVF